MPPHDVEHTIPSEDPTFDQTVPSNGNYNGRNHLYLNRGRYGRSGSMATTGSATSDEDVLKGAYGGHITAGGDDLFPRDRLRAINDDNVMSPNRSDYIKGHR